ncbi:MAG: hypothetical protein ACRCZ0_09475, partial [Cetobacterium sp.]
MFKSVEVKDKVYEARGFSGDFSEVRCSECELELDGVNCHRALDKAFGVDRVRCSDTYGYIFRPKYEKIINYKG